MPLGVPNYNPPAPSGSKPKPPPRQQGPTLMEQAIGSGGRAGPDQQGPVAPGTPVYSSSPYSGFQVSPEYSNVGAWSGWGDDAPLTGDWANRAGANVWRNLVPGQSYSNEQYYTNQYGADQVQRARQSGLDPEVFFSLGKAGQDQAVAWGTNLGNAADITAQQRNAFDANVDQRVQTNSFIDEFGNLQDLRGANLMDQYTSGLGMAQARYDLGMDQLQSGLDIDLGILGQRRYRDVDLGRQDNAAALLHNSNMRGVLDTRRGLIGESFSTRQGYLNDQLGFIGDRQDLAYDRYQTNDAYLGQQAKDLMAQYGFASREYDTQIEEAFANRNTQQRAAVSDSAARGAFGSAGFGDNIQDIYGGYDRQTDRAGLQLDRTTQSIEERDKALGNQRDNLGFGYDEQVIGFNESIRNINNQHDQNRIGTQGAYNDLTGQYSANDLERTKLQNVNKGLDSLAKEYGLREQDMRNQFNNAVDKMGLDLNETNQRLEQMLNSGNADIMAQGMNFMRQMMAYQ